MSGLREDVPAVERRIRCVGGILIASSSCLELFEDRRCLHWCWSSAQLPGWLSEMLSFSCHSFPSLSRDGHPIVSRGRGWAVPHPPRWMSLSSQITSVFQSFPSSVSLPENGMVQCFSFFGLLLGIADRTRWGCRSDPSFLTRSLRNFSATW